MYAWKFHRRDKFVIQSVTGGDTGIYGVSEKKMFFFCPLYCLSFFDVCLYQVRVITVFPVFRLLTDFVCLYTYEYWLSLCKIVRSSVILLLPLFSNYSFGIFKLFLIWNICIFLNRSTLYGSLSIQHVYASPNFH